jgi:Fic family protein
MRILKRKKGKEEFFYIQHSYRQNGKIITREKYLGKNIPSQTKLDKIKADLARSKLKELEDKLAKIKYNFQNEWKNLPPSIQKKELEKIAIAFTYNTNAIEGSKITQEETRSIIEDKISPNKPLKDIRETENHARIFLGMLDMKEKLNRTIILNWHKEIFSESKPDIAGKFRNYLVTIGEHLAPDWQDIEYLMKNFFIGLNQPSKENIIDFIARIHYRFEKIHPFGDGNGRMGRLMINYLLWNNGYPMLIIPYKKRRAYNKAFNKDEDYFAKYFLRLYLSVNKRRYLT